MLKLLYKLLPVLIFWGIFAYVILQIPYPNSLTQATPLQLLAFFISLFLAIIFTLNIFLSFFPLSLSLTIALIFLLILKALDSLNLVTGVLILIVVWLLFSYFKKGGSKSLNPIKSGLTSQSKIPKLTTLQRRKR